MIIIKRIAATATEHTGDKLRKQSCLNRSSFKYRVTSWFLFGVINTSSVWEKILRNVLFIAAGFPPRGRQKPVLPQCFTSSVPTTHYYLNQSAGITGLTGRDI